MTRSPSAHPSTRIRLSSSEGLVTPILGLCESILGRCESILGRCVSIPGTGSLSSLPRISSIGVTPSLINIAPKSPTLTSSFVPLRCLLPNPTDTLRRCCGGLDAPAGSFAASAITISGTPIVSVLKSGIGIVDSRLEGGDLDSGSYDSSYAARGHPSGRRAIRAKWDCESGDVESGEVMRYRGSMSMNAEPGGESSIAVWLVRDDM